MTYALGLKAIKKLVATGDAYAFQQSKLSEKLFKGESEKAVFKWVDNHVAHFKQLPQMVTLESMFPEIKEVECPENTKYYLFHVEQRFVYDRLDKAAKQTQELLKESQNNVGPAKEEMLKALNEITEQQYRNRILNFPQEGQQVVMKAYHKMFGSETPPSAFGWPYMDDSTGGAQAGDVISVVGRPAMGKSQFMLYMAAHNWKRKHKNVLFVSMEMNCVSVAQRLAAMYAHTNLTQLKMGQFSTQTLKSFGQKISFLHDEPGQFYVVDGNLAAHCDDIYNLSSQLSCDLVVIDGAYLLRHKDRRLGRYEKVAENVELMKRLTGEVEIPTFCSWQFAKSGAKSQLKGGQVGLEHIGMTESVGQISTIVLALNQEEGVETLNSRLIEVLKGRNGETGQFRVNWDWNIMDFSQHGIVKPQDEPEHKTIGYL